MDTTSNSLLCLPWEILLEILCYLPPKAICSCSQTCKNLYKLSKDPMLWRELLRRDFAHFDAAIGIDLLNSQENELTLSQSGGHPPSWFEAPWKLYYAENYQASQVKSLAWISRYHANIEERQDHAATRCGDYLVVYAGFTNDQSLYVLDTQKQVKEIKNYYQSDSEEIENTMVDWYQCEINDSGPSSRLLYGHTLTNLDSSTLILYGGMQAPGYRLETSDVWLLHLNELQEKKDDSLKSEENNENKMETDISLAPFTWKWEKPNIMGVAPPPRGYHSATISHGKLWIFGGTFNRNTQNDFWCLDLHTWTWHQVEDNVEDRPCPRMGHSCIAFCDELLFFGGSNIPFCQEYGDDFSDAFAFNIKSLSWRKLSNCPGRFIGRRHAAVLIGHSILFIGGSCPHTNDVASFDILAESWSIPIVRGKKPSPRVSLSAHFCNGLIFVFGGCTDFGQSQELFLLDSSDTSTALARNKIQDGELEALPRYRAQDSLLSLFLSLAQAQTMDLSE